jgi:ubiquinone/menaquinone biosynthesis C-methylase UbiE
MEYRGGSSNATEYRGGGQGVTHEDHLALIAAAVNGSGGSWADLGSGGGAFTTALVELLGAGGRIASVDSDQRALRLQERELRTRFPTTSLQFIRADFNDELPLTDLDGIVMANSLHFQREACAVLTHVSRMLAQGGRLVVVEYDIETANPWVPYPLPFTRLPDVAACAGFSSPRLLGSRPSRYHRRVYSAVCLRAGA